MGLFGKKLAESEEVKQLQKEIKSLEFCKQTVNKKTLQLIVIVGTMMFSLTGCCLSHEWLDADCVNPKTCTKCEKMEGEALGHRWEDATCTVARTCSVCGTTEGEALGHRWEDATCMIAKTCRTCGATEGEVLGHTWIEATCEVPQTCSVCGATEGETLGHAGNEIGICTRCGKQSTIIITSDNFEEYFEVVILEEIHSVKDLVSPVEDVYDFVTFKIISKCKMDLYSLEVDGMLTATCIDEEYADNEYMTISLIALPTASGYAYDAGRTVVSDVREVLFGRFALSNALRLYFSDKPSYIPIAGYVFEATVIEGEILPILE